MIPKLRPERIIEALQRYDKPCKVVIHPFLWNDLQKEAVFAQYVSAIVSREYPFMKNFEILYTRNILTNELFKHTLEQGETGDPTVVLIVPSVTESITVRVVQWKPLQDFTDQELLDELKRRDRSFDDEVHARAMELMRAVLHKLEAKKSDN